MSGRSVLSPRTSLALGLIAVLLAVSCGGSAEQAATSSTSAPSTTSASTTSLATTSSTAIRAGCPPPPVEQPSAGSLVQVYLICDGAQTPEPVQRVVVGGDVPAAALREIFKPVSADEHNAGFATWVREPTTVRSVRTQGAELLIDFSQELEAVNNLNTSNGAAQFFSQLALTAFQFPEIQRVIATIETSESRFCEFFGGDPRPGSCVIRRR